MNHETAVHRIGDLLRGRLSKSERRRILEHISGCDECTELSVTHFAIAQAFREVDEQPGEHPSANALARYAVAPHEVADARRAEIDSHVQQCPTCATEVGLSRFVDTDLDPAGPLVEGRVATDRRLRSPLVAAAASVALLLLGFAAYAVLFGAPWARPRPEIVEWTGPVQLPLLQAPLRDLPNEATEVVLEGTQPVVSLAVVPVVRDGDKPQDVIVFRIRNAAGSLIWTQDLTVDRVRHYAASSGAVTFLVPSVTLPDGRYDLEIRWNRDTAPGALVQMPFVVRRR